MAVRKLRLKESSLNSNYNKVTDIIKDVKVYPIDRNVLKDLLVNMFENALKQNDISYKLDDFDININDNNLYTHIHLGGDWEYAYFYAYAWDYVGGRVTSNEPSKMITVETRFVWNKQVNEIALNVKYGAYEGQSYEEFITDLQDIETLVVRPILEEIGYI